MHTTFIEKFVRDLRRMDIYTYSCRGEGYSAKCRVVKGMLHKEF